MIYHIQQFDCFPSPWTVDKLYLPHVVRLKLLPPTCYFCEIRRRLSTGLGYVLCSYITVD